METTVVESIRRPIADILAEILPKQMKCFMHIVMIRKVRWNTSQPKLATQPSAPPTGTRTPFA